MTRENTCAGVGVGKGRHPYPLCHAYRQNDEKLFTYPPSLLIGPFKRRDKTFIFSFTHYAVT